MDFAHLADGTGLDELHRQAILGRRMNLDAHLRDELLLPRELGELAALVDVVRQRLLTIDVQAALHGRHCHRRVHVVGRGDVDGSEALFLVEHLAPVGVDAQVRILLLQIVRLARFHIGDGNKLDVLVADDLRQVRARHAAGAEARVEDAFGRRRADQARDEERRGDGREGGRLEKGATRELR